MAFSQITIWIARENRLFQQNRPEAVGGERQKSAKTGRLAINKSVPFPYLLGGKGQSAEKFINMFHSFIFGDLIHSLTHSREEISLQSPKSLECFNSIFRVGRI